MEKQSLGFVGLGLMGSRMSARLLEAGYVVRGHDIDPRRVAEHQARGGIGARSALEAMRGCRFVVLSLPNSDVSREVLLGDHGLIASGAGPVVVYDTTTGRPEDAVEISARLAEVGVTYCDATVSGNSAGARRGDLVVMVGGTSEAYEQGAGIFAVIGRSHHHVGPAGAGARMKLLVNHILTIHRTALAEGLVVAELAGMDLHTTLDVLKDSLAYSKAMDVWGDRMIAADHAEPDARLRQSLKDARLIVEHATGLGAPAELATVVRDTLDHGAQSGLGEMDNSSVIEVLRRRAGTGRVPDRWEWRERSYIVQDAIVSEVRVIDIHCHRECAQAAALVEEEGARQGRAPLQVGNELTREVNRRQLEELRPKMESIDVRLADMDAMGVDIQALTVSPYHLFYWAAGELGATAFEAINDDLAAVVAEHPDRFVGLGAVPLQDESSAIAELKRCREDLDFPGIEVSTQVNGEELSSPRLHQFWGAVEDLGMVVFIHPTGFTHPDRFTDHYFYNTIGHPLESTLCAGRLIFDGVLDRHPELKIVIAHGGGFLPAYAGRFDHAYHAREDVRHGLPRPPSEYLAMLYFDTMVFEPDQLGFLIGRYGPDHVLLGTDYPYDMGEDDPLGLLDRVDGLGAEDKTMIRGGNAARLLGLG